ncbi:allantoinase [Paenibacillus sp. FSL H8-0034]|uniref:allantoinase n=1 Tax=Paenibacillus sp. FSL H8-0034 TaxID=2954671 RepID=UPI0030FC5A3F
MGMLDLKITGAFVVMKQQVARMDIGVMNGKIVSLSDTVAMEAKQHIHAAGLYMLPGMVDAHVHFNEPGMGHWEGFESGSSALAAGGCTTYIDMPLNGLPPTVSVPALNVKLQAANRSLVDYALWGGLVPGNLDQLESLAEAGVIGFKAFMSEPGGDGIGRFERADRTTLLEGMKRIAKLGRILALHAEDEEMVAALAAESIRKGKTDAHDFAESRPISAECAAVRQALLMAEETGCALHFVHISSAEAVWLIQEAKLKGMDVTLETCPHYLTLTVDDMVRQGAVAKCAPPLRSMNEQTKLWEVVAAGCVDIIASDHSPCPLELKQQRHFFEAWGGIAGAQSSLELMVDEGHIQRKLPLPLIIAMLSLNPARRFGLHPQKGEIALGADADLVLMDLDHSYTLENSHLKQRHAYSPYIGKRFNCRVMSTWVRGQLVYELNAADQISENKGRIAADPQGIWLSGGA